MKPTHLFPFTMAFVVLLGGLSSSEACPKNGNNTTYALMCRGRAPVNYLPSDGLLFGNITANAKAAGKEGEALAVGACAWVDRALNADEPKMWSLQRKDSHLGSVSSFVGNCLSDVNCVIKFCAHNDNVLKVLVVHPDVLATKFPKF